MQVGIKSLTPPATMDLQHVLRQTRFPCSYRTSPPQAMHSVQLGVNDRPCFAFIYIYIAFKYRLSQPAKACPCLRCSQAGCFQHHNTMRPAKGSQRPRCFSCPASASPGLILCPMSADMYIGYYHLCTSACPICL